MSSNNQLIELRLFVEGQEKDLNQMSGLLTAAYRQIEEANDMKGELEYRDITGGQPSSTWTDSATERLEQSFTRKLLEVKGTMERYALMARQMKAAIHSYASPGKATAQPQMQEA